VAVVVLEALSKARVAPVELEAPGQPVMGQPVTGQGRAPCGGVGCRPVERGPQGGARPVPEKLIRLLVM
jgi:hypothetical protein